MILGQLPSVDGEKSIVYEQPEIKEVNALKYELEMFVDAIVHDKPTVVTADEGMQALSIAHEIMKKISQQKLVL